MSVSKHQTWLGLVIACGVGVAVEAQAPRTPDLSQRDTDLPANAREAGIETEAAAEDRPGYQPDPSLPTVEVELVLDWAADEGVVTATHWGVNTYSMAAPAKSRLPRFAPFLSALSPGMVRVHHSGLTDFWSSAETRVFDRQVIRRTLGPAAAVPEASLMVTFPDWPEWFSESKFIPPDRYDEAEALFRDFVRAVVEASPVPVTHIEIFNEFDNTWAKRDAMPELWRLYNRFAVVARSEAPGVKVGGPALTWANPDWVGPFLDTSGEHIDFLSWHAYAVGKPTDSNEQVFRRVREIASDAAAVHQALRERGLTHVETHLNELHVKWTWKPYEPRHGNHIGAAFLAATVAELTRDGITCVAMWHAMGNAYGLMDIQADLRPAGQFYLLATRYLTGRRAYADTPGSDALVLLPLVRECGRCSLLLVNLGEASVRLRTEADENETGLMTRFGIDADGCVVEGLSSLHGMSLPGWSVSVVIWDEPPFPLFGRYTLPGTDKEFGF